MSGKMTSEHGQGGRGNWRGAIIVALVAFGVLVWNLLAFRIIGNRPRNWSYGVAPAIPAESYASSEPPPPPSQAPKQVELPPPVSKEGSR
jgi:hypothetical protein